MRQKRVVIVTTLLSLKARREFGVKIAHTQFFRNRLYPRIFGQEEKSLLSGECKQKAISKTDVPLCRVLLIEGKCAFVRFHGSSQQRKGSCNIVEVGKHRF